MKHYARMIMRLLLAYTGCLIVLLAASSAETVFRADNVRHGDRSLPRIAITIDDCYNIDHVISAIELCEEYEVPVTFFVIGKALKFADGPVWQRALDAGCEIGNHSWGHVQLTQQTARKIKFHMLRAQQKVDEMLGYHYPMQVMRPPLGKSNKKVEEAVAAVGYPFVVRWDVSQTDPKKALKAVENGSILLYHANVRDIRCLETLIPQLIENGYECVTVSELLGLAPVVTSPEIYIYQPEDAGS